MKKRRIAIALCFTLFTAFSLSGCDKKVQPENKILADNLADDITPHPISSDALSADDMLHDTISATDFSVRLFHGSMKENQNTLISPYSVLTALAMTANGADGETLSQMEATFGLSVDELNKYLYLYQKSLPSGDKYKLNSANSIWLRDRDGLSLNKDFLQTSKDYYNAEIYRAPFDSSTLKDINGWVEDNTDGMVKNILDKISPEDILYLINAVAFDAEWQNIYTDADVRDDYFTKEDNTMQDCQLMYSEEYTYIEDLSATGFLKYYADGKYAFAALLPDENTSVSEYAASLTGEKLNGLLTYTKDVTVRAAIPKFETEYFIEMKDVLKAMGMTDAFDGGLADFSKLTDGGLYIDRVLHKALISVDEKGTKAGAATIVAMPESCPVEDEVKTVHLDRPFIYMLIDCENKLPVFMGTVVDMEK